MKVHYSQIVVNVLYKEDFVRYGLKWLFYCTIQKANFVWQLGKINFYLYDISPDLERISS